MQDNTSPRTLTRSNLIPNHVYGARRAVHRRAIIDMKKNRRVAVGPNVTLLFENFATLVHHVQEMLWVEGGGEEQINDELAAYAPLVPRGDELVATMMIEFSDPNERRFWLGQLTHIETHTALFYQDGPREHTVTAVPENDAERTRDDGKTSAVHFLRFPLGSLAPCLGTPEGVWSVKISHPHYMFETQLTPEQRHSLAHDVSA